MNPEKLFSDMAKLYVNKEGKQLHIENGRLFDNAPFPPSVDFEKNIRMKIRAEKYRRPVYVLSVIAACVLITLVSVNVMTGLLFDSRPRGAREAQTDMRAQGESRTTTAAAHTQTGQMGQTGQPEQPGQTVQPGQMGQTGQTVQPGQPWQSGQPGQSGIPVNSGNAGIGYDVITLAFNLPSSCSVRDVEQDVGKTIYYISDTKKDDIVLIAERSAEFGGTGHYNKEKLKKSGLTEIEINGESVFAVAKADFNYFTFQRDGVIYDMTCKYDYNTLIALCEYIL